MKGGENKMNTFNKNDLMTPKDIDRATKLFYFFVGVAVGLIIGWFMFSVTPTEAKPISCKHENAECDINKSDKMCCPGLICMDKGRPSTNGKCVNIMDQLRPKCSPTPTPKVEEPEEPTLSPEPSLPPVQPPQIDVTVPSNPLPPESTNTTSAPSACTPRQFMIIPTVWNVGRIDSDSIFARWTDSDEGVTQYVVFYGTEKDNLKWNTFVHGNYVELHALPENQHIWISVAGYDGCDWGPTSFPVDP